MNCRKCGNQLIPGEKFCRICGELVQEQNNIVNQQSVSNQYSNNNMNVQQGYVNQTQSSMNQMNMQQPITNQQNQYQTMTQSVSPNNNVQNMSSLTQPIGNEQSQMFNPLGNNIVQPMQQSQNNTSLQPSNIQSNNQIMISDEELIDAYIGPNAEKIKNQKFSVMTLLFSVIYVWSRKLNRLASFWICFNYLTSYALDMVDDQSLKLLIVIGSFIPNFIVAFIFHDYYLKDAEKKVKIIKEQNVGKSNEEIKQICSEKGGVSKPVVVLGIVVYTIYLVLIGINLKAADDTRQNEINESQAKSSSLSLIDTVEYYTSSYAPDGIKKPTYNNGNVVCKTENGTTWNGDVDSTSTSCNDFMNAVMQKYNGDKIDSATIAIDIEGSVISGTIIKINEYYCSYNGLIAICSKNEIEDSVDTLKESIISPVEKNTTKLNYTIPTNFKIYQNKNYGINSTLHVYRNTNSSEEFYSIAITKISSIDTAVNEEMESSYISETRVEAKEQLKEEANNASDMSFKDGTINYKTINTVKWKYVVDNVICNSIGFKGDYILYSTIYNNDLYIIAMFVRNNINSAEPEYSNFINSLKFE